MNCKCMDVRMMILKRYCRVSSWKIGYPSKGTNERALDEVSVLTWSVGKGGSDGCGHQRALLQQRVRHTTQNSYHQRWPPSPPTLTHVHQGFVNKKKEVINCLVYCAEKQGGVFFCGTPVVGECSGHEISVRDFFASLPKYLPW